MPYSSMASLPLSLTDCMGTAEAQFWIGVHGAVIGERNRILLLRRAPTMLYCPGHWDLPGGHLTHDENFDECLHREIAEETGLQVELGPLLGINKANDGPYVQMIFACRMKPPFRQIKLRPEEHDAAQWINAAQIDQVSPLIPYLDAILARGMLDHIIF
ncbi:MAG TPA: NUDIX hydrolase [Candidatus Binataceae bacterium]|nr:NUDIX hydrolase [Candidatus Binataceae bacterium]